MRKFLTALLLIMALASPAHALDEWTWKSDWTTAWTAMKNASHWYYTKVRDIVVNNAYPQQPWNFDLAYHKFTPTKTTADKFLAKIEPYYCGTGWSPSGCSWIVANDFRAYFWEWIRGYVYFKALNDPVNGLDSTQLSKLYDIIDGQLTHYLTVDNGNYYFGDQDQTVFLYFNMALWAATNQWIGNTSRYNELVNWGATGLGGATGFGGLAGPGTAGSLRRWIYDEWGLKSAGGEIPTGSEYGTEMAYALEHIIWLNQYFGVNNYEDFTDNVDAIINAGTHSMTPDFAEIFQWGDAQETRRNVDVLLLKAAAELSDTSALKARANYIFNQRWLTYQGPMSRTQMHGVYNPYGSPSSFDLTGNTAYNSFPSGHAYYHTGWTASDSAFFSLFLQRFFGDHHPSYFSNMEWYRHGDWALTHVRSYLDGNELLMANTLALWGGAGCMQGQCESAQQIAYEANTTDKWVYHAGAMGGDIGHSPCMWSPLDPQALKEWTESRVFLSNNDGSETIVQFDRLYTLDPRNSNGYSTFAGSWSKAENITNKSAKHTFLWQTPATGNLSVSGHVYSWTAWNGDTIDLHALMGGNETYTTVDVEEQDSGNDFKRLEISEASNADGFRSFINVLHTGSTETITEITASSGESARGILLSTGSEKKAVLFNATANTPLADPALIDCGYGFPSGFAWDDNKHVALRNQSYFKTGTTFTIPTTAATKVIIVDLDPSRTWTANIDGAGAASITPSAQGVYSVSLSASGSNHTIVLASTSLCNSTDWRACTVSNCATNGWFWYNNVCNQSAQCDAQNLTGCNATTCAAIPLYWYNNTCNLTPAPTCDASHCSLCTTNQSQCETATCYWWEDNTCHSGAAPGCDDDCSLCADATECGNSQYPCYWWSNECNSTEQPSYEDLTTWYKYDPMGYQAVTFTQSSTLGQRVPGDAVTYLNKDSGTDYWTTFKHHFDLRSSAYDGYKLVRLVPWSISNSSAATYSGLNSGGNGIGLIFDPYGNKVTLINFITQESDTDNGATWVWDNWRYYTVERTDSTITCKIYSSAARGEGNLLDTLTIPYDATAFRYTTISASDGSADSSSYEMVAVANVDIGQSSGPIEPPAPAGPTKIFGGCSMGGGQF